MHDDVQHKPDALLPGAVKGVPIPVRAVSEAATQSRLDVLAGHAPHDADAWILQNALNLAIREAMPDAVMVVNEQGNIVSVNSQFELMFGYHRSEVLGQKPEMLMPTATRAKHAHLREGYSAEPRLRDMSNGAVLMAQRKSGLVFPVRINLGPVVIPSGVFTIVVIRRARDTTTG